MERQKTDWGSINWLEGKTNNDSSQGLRTGIVTLATGAHQPRHIHFEEQVIYILQGRARSLINGKENIQKPGDLFHWKAGVRHEVFNIGNEPFVHLMVSSPMQGGDDEYYLTDETKTENADSDLIYMAVEAVRTQFLEVLRYGYAIFGAMGNLILQSRYMPEFCEECCQVSACPGKCPCMLWGTQKEWVQEQTFYCPNGLEIFEFPIFFGSTFLGYIQGGYIRHESSTDEKLKEVYDVPESVIYGIRALLKRIVKALRNYCEFEQFRKNLTEKELKLADNEQARRTLAKSLEDTQYTVTDLKLNHHFLFNTLNSMASMALDSGSMNLYQSIVYLSKMFRYTLRIQTSIVPLSNETEYVNAYLQLQKLRYGDSLEIKLKINPKVLTAKAPFNFLQPVVENVFSHGFDDHLPKKLRLEAGMNKNHVRIRVINSGKKLTEENIRTVNQGIRGNTSHGLSMVYRKMQTVFGLEFRFLLSSLKNGETCFIIEFPFHGETAETENSKNEGVTV